MTIGLDKSATASRGGSVSSRQFAGRKIRAVAGMALIGCGTVGHYLISTSAAMDEEWGYLAFIGAAAAFIAGAVLLAALLSPKPLSGDE